MISLAENPQTKSHTEYIATLIEYAEPLALKFRNNTNKRESIREINYSLPPGSRKIVLPKESSISLAWGDPELTSIFLKNLSHIENANHRIQSANFETFPQFYGQLIYNLLVGGYRPARCHSCGKPFFPTGSNSKYCSRFNIESGLFCNPALNAKNGLGKKSPHNTATSLRRKAKTARQSSIKTARYFEDHAEFVDHQAGPIYKNSSNISEELYSE